LKYLWGYVTAGIIAAIAWVLSQFGARFSALVDMFYPYVDRIVMDYLANWSAGFAGSLWQTGVVFLAVLLLGSAVLMIALRWNPVQWFGWVLTAAGILVLLNTGIYGINAYAGPISEDVRLSVNEYSSGSLERAASYYGQMATEYAKKVKRTGKYADFSDFDTLAEQAAKGYTVLTYERGIPIFSGTTVPVKKQGWMGRADGKTGMTVGLTGESAVNPDVPEVGLPFAICHEMNHRMCIYNDSDASFGAFLACTANSSHEFIYSGYLMAFRTCYNALAGIDSQLGRDSLNRVMAYVSDDVMNDMAQYNTFFGEDAQQVDEQLTNLLVSWHVQEIAQYGEDEEEDVFDPMDESDERFQDILNPSRTGG
jgi:hypothetical protein